MKGLGLGLNVLTLSTMVKVSHMFYNRVRVIVRFKLSN